MAGELRVETLSPDAIFFVDSRQFESGVYKYDERIANSFLYYHVVQDQPNQSEDEQLKEEAPLLKANP